MIFIKNLLSFYLRPQSILCCILCTCRLAKSPYMDLAHAYNVPRHAHTLDQQEWIKLPRILVPGHLLHSRHYQTLINNQHAQKTGMQVTKGWNKNYMVKDFH